MSLTPGTRLGPYEISAQIGAGGMGEVYRATDTHLGREVAIKVLPDAVAHDAERLARFERESRTLAGLNHPNIATVHGLEKSGTTQALVMELVDGLTLADRIAQGPLPLDEALPIAKQIAEALEAAHEQGVIHRDLKPSNVKLRPDGTVKVLDFGLAKAMEPTPGVASNASLSPTITSPAMTQLGVILGTAAYMSPEQAKGRAADRRTDIWAFGCVLYELLTGRRLFGGDDVSDTMAAVLRADPDWSALPRDTPSSIRRLLERCLEKDRTRRLQHAADAAIRILEASSEPAVHDGVSTPTSRLWPLAAAAATITAVLLAVVAAFYFREGPAAEIRTDITVPPTIDPASFALSPDGQQVVFAASDQGVQRLWLRKLATTEVQPLPGTEGAAAPFWKPDSKEIGFFAEGRLKILALGAGQPRVLTSVTGGRGGTWNAEDVIVFNQTGTGPLFRVPAAGGTPPTAVTTLGGATVHRHPCFLPDGRHFLFFANGGPDVLGVYLGQLDSTQTTRLTASSTAGVYLAPGWVMWIDRDGSFVAQRLDIQQRRLVGDVVRIAARATSEAGGAAAISTSATGLVAYRSGLQTRRQLQWFNRSGGPPTGVMGAPDEYGLGSPRLSPDSSQVSVTRAVDGNADIWLLDASGRATRWTSDARLDRFAVWSPKTDRIVFDTNRRGPRDLYIGFARERGREKILLESKTGDSVPMHWSPDERYLAYLSIEQPNYDVWAIPLETLKPFPLLKSTSFIEKGPRFSPDGQFLAYMSNESGRMEIYVGRFVEPGRDRAGGVENSVPVSVGGGIYPAWEPHGRELYYLAPDGMMMAVSITLNGADIQRGSPVALFQTRILGGGVDNQQGWQYDVSHDGRFLVNALLDDATPITLLQNWKAP